MIRVISLFGVSIIPLIIFLASGVKTMAQDEDLSVLSRWMRWSDAPNMLYHHLGAQAFKHLEERAARVSTLKTEAQWRRRQEEIRQTLMEIVGPFPEKTPLNPRIVGILDREEGVECSGGPQSNPATERVK